MDGFTPVIVIEGFLGLGVVLLLYWLHIREMKQIRAEKARRAAKESAAVEPPAAPAGEVTHSDTTVDTPLQSPR